MPAQLNHMIVWCRDNAASAGFLAHILGLPPPRPFLHFMMVELDNAVTLDFMAKDGPIAAQHYAFLVDEAEFDAGFERIRAAGLEWWADPARTKAGQVAHYAGGGRGVYFKDPDGHLLELTTRAVAPG